jgi:peptidoglycan/xylan/chitin deacetylase (PgdA/CDA1 family)
MSWRVNLWQQFWHRLLQLRNRTTHPTRALLGTWPGLLTLALLLCTLAVGGILFSRASTDASAQAPSAAVLAQIPTLVPTHAPVVIVVATKTATPTAAPRQATPTRTPTSTATQIAASPLLVATGIPTQVVPLPTDLAGPQIAPVDVFTDTNTGIVAASVTLTSETTLPGTVTPTPTTDVLLLLVPTPTPTATPSIIEALEQPVAPGGLAGIAATATAAAPPSNEEPSEEPTVTDAESAEVEAVAPQPTATLASQPTPDGSVRTVHVPILMYHYLSVPPANADIYRLDLSVTPDLFAAHLDAIQQAGYTTISLYTLLDHLTHGSPLPEKPVVLTFDDGYRDNYTNAFPLLRDRGLTATFFIVTDFINDQRPEYLTWDMVREMYASGMSIEGHGRNHVSLANKDRDYLIWQALGTYESIEHEIGVRPHFISYPAGDYDQLTIDIFSSANYWAGFTTKQGATHSSDDLFRMERIRVRGSTSTEELLRLLALDW